VERRRRGAHVPSLFPPLLGYSVAAADAAAAACKWSAITAIVLNAPYVAKVATTGAERVLGTVVGGAAGFLAYSFCHSLDRTPGAEIDDGLLLAGLAAAMAYAASTAGARLGLVYSAKLCAQSFIIVAFGASAKEAPPAGAGVLAASRVAGIVAGVVLVEAASVLLWPVTATERCLAEIGKGLKATLTTSDTVWRSLLLWTAAAEERGGGAGRPSESPAAPLLDPESPTNLSTADADAAAADAVSAGGAAVTAALDAAADLASASAAEIYMGAPCGVTPVFLPGTPWGPAVGRALDPAAVAAAVATVRRVARGLVALHSVRPRTDAYAPMLASTYDPALLESAAADTRAALAAAAAAFPGPPPPAAAAAAARVAAHAAALFRISDYAKRALHRAATRGARTSSTGVEATPEPASAPPSAPDSPTDALDSLASDPDAGGGPSLRERLRRRLAGMSSSQLATATFPATTAGFEAHVRWLATQLALAELAADVAAALRALAALSASLPTPLMAGAAAG